MDAEVSSGGGAGKSPRPNNGQTPGPDDANGLIEPLPADVDAAVRGRLAADEEPLVVMASDMLSDGTFGQAWLIATTKRLLSYQRNGSSSGGFIELALADARLLERRDLPGCHQLQVHASDRAVTLAWYSRVRQEPFDRAIEVLRPLIDRAAADAGHQPATESSNDTGGRPGNKHKHMICETCGKPFPRRLGVCVDCMDQRRILTRLCGRMKPYWLPATCGLLLMLALTAIEMSQPLLLKAMIDVVIPNRDYDLFAWVIAGIIAIYVFSAVFTGVRAYLMAWFGQKIVYDLRAELYEHMQELSIEFYDRKGTGWIMDRITSDTSNLQNFLAEGLQDLIRDAMTIVVIISIIFWLDWRLATITLLPAPLVVILTLYFYKRAHRLWHNIWRKRSRMSALLADVVPGVRVVKAFSREEHENDRFMDRNRDFMNTSVRAQRTFAVFHPMVGFVTGMGYVAIWGYGGYRALSGAVEVGTLIAFIAYLMRFYGPLNNLSRLAMNMQQAATSAQRVFEVLDTDADVRSPTDRRHMPRIEGRVELENVTFGYEPSLPVLKDLTCTIEPGEMVGLVGPSGAGKSTTINLLCRFYDVDEGSIRVDGIDIRDVTLGSFRSQLGVVLQETFLFQGSLAENISYGNPDATPADVIRAAKAANAHDFIMGFPDGYDTLASERGVRLSGGERQRIAIARAILKDPRILILDEATASVDTETEAAIREALDRLVQGRTTIAIAHRFSTLRNASRLIVLDQGRIVEIGSHQELMAKEDGVFRRMYEMQNDLNRIIAIGG